MSDLAASLRDQILSASAGNVVVHACLQLWRAGDAAWEEAMMVAVMALARQNKDLQRHVIDAEKWARRPLLFSRQEIERITAEADSRRKGDRS